MKKFLILTFLFLIVGMPLSVKANYEKLEELEDINPENLQAQHEAQTIKSPSNLYCALQCMKELRSCLHQFEGGCYQDYFECRGGCTGEDDISDLAPLVDISEIQCKLRCELEYQECRDDHPGLQGIRTCLKERKECKETCESESDEENYKNSIIRNLR